MLNPNQVERYCVSLDLTHAQAGAHQKRLAINGRRCEKINKKKTRGNEVDSIIKQNNRRAKVGNSHGKPNKISKNGTNSPRHAAVCHGVTREEEDGSSGACVLGAGGYCGNIFV